MIDCGNYVNLISELLLIIIWVTSCQAQDAPKLPVASISPTVIDPLFHPYLDEFNQDCPNTGRLRSFVFGNPELEVEDAVGLCWPDTGNIVVSKEWKNWPPLIKRILLYHELGHCLLGLDHSEGEWDIMSPEIGVFQPYKYAPWPELVNQMCGD